MRLTTKQKSDLGRVIRMLEFGEHTFMPSNLGPFKTAGEARAFIVEATRLWRDTWILPQLRKLLEDGGGIVVPPDPLDREKAAHRLSIVGSERDENRCWAECSCGWESDQKHPYDGPGEAAAERDHAAHVQRAVAGRNR